MATDWPKWEAVLSPLALKLWQEINLAGAGERIDIGELMASTGRRKTPIRSALAELEHHGFIHIEEVEA